MPSIFWALAGCSISNFLKEISQTGFRAFIHRASLFLSSPSTESADWWDTHQRSEESRIIFNICYIWGISNENMFLPLLLVACQRRNPFYELLTVLTLSFIILMMSLVIIKWSVFNGEVAPRPGMCFCAFAFSLLLLQPAKVSRHRCEGAGNWCCSTLCVLMFACRKRWSGDECASVWEVNGGIKAWSPSGVGGGKEANAEQHSYNGMCAAMYVCVFVWAYPPGAVD